MIAEFKKLTEEDKVDFMVMFEEIGIEVERKQTT